MKSLTVTKQVICLSVHPLLAQFSISHDSCLIPLPPHASECKRSSWQAFRTKTWQKRDKSEKRPCLVVHAVSTRFFKKVGAGLLETRHHIMKLLISNIFSFNLIKAINQNWIILLISCFCLFYQKMPSQTQSKGTVKPKKIKLYFKSKNNGELFQSKNVPWKQKNMGEDCVCFVLDIDPWTRASGKMVRARVCSLFAIKTCVNFAKVMVILLGLGKEG